MMLVVQVILVFWAAYYVILLAVLERLFSVWKEREPEKRLERCCPLLLLCCEGGRSTGPSTSLSSRACWKAAGATAFLHLCLRCQAYLQVV